MCISHCIENNKYTQLRHSQRADKHTHDKESFYNNIFEAENMLIFISFVI